MLSFKSHQQVPSCFAESWVDQAVGLDGGCSTRGEVPGTNLSLLLLHFCFYLKEAMGKDSGLSELGVGGWAGLLTEPARSSYGQASWGAGESLSASPMDGVKWSQPSTSLESSAFRREPPPP